MTGFVLSRRAQADLSDIWDYTARQWNADQADRYVRQLQQAIESVAEQQNKGRPCDEIRSGYRRIAAGSHVLFYRVVTGRIEVIRILHQRMDFERHLR